MAVSTFNMLDFYLGNANLQLDHLRNSFMILRNHQYHPPTLLLRGFGMTPLYKAMLHGKDDGIPSLQQPFAKLIFVNPCLRLSTCNLIIVQMTTSVITCFVFIFAYGKGYILRGYFVTFFMVGHTHDEKPKFIFGFEIVLAQIQQDNFASLNNNCGWCMISCDFSVYYIYNI